MLDAPVSAAAPAPGPKVEIFVPGRVALFGEHSDWAGGFRRFNSAIVPGRCIVTGTNQGLFATAQKHHTHLVLRSVLLSGEEHTFSVRGGREASAWLCNRLCHSLPPPPALPQIEMDPEKLLEAASVGNFFAHACPPQRSAPLSPAKLDCVFWRRPLLKCAVPLFPPLCRRAPTHRRILVLRLWRGAAGVHTLPRARHRCGQLLHHTARVQGPLLQRRHLCHDRACLQSYVFPPLPLSLPRPFLS